MLEILKSYPSCLVKLKCHRDHDFRIQVLNYDPSSDIIEIVHYNKKSAQNDAMNVYTYRFLLFSKGTEVSVSESYAVRGEDIDSEN
jgi:hypothetical protein